MVDQPAGARVLDLKRKDAALPFFLLLFYLFLEYGRPQDQFHFISVLRLPAITVTLLLLSIILYGKLRLEGKQTVLFLVLLGLMVVHGPIAVNNYWALMIFITMTINFIVFLSLTLLVTNTEKFDKLIKVWLGIHVLLAVIGILKGSGRGIGGFLGDENDFCMTMNMILPFPFFLSMQESGKKRIFHVILACLFLTAILLTQSRGGFVGLVATVIYCWLRSKRKILIGSIAGLLAVVAMIVAPPTYWEEVRSISEEGTTKGTGATRIYTWGIGWHMFLDNPIIGVGQGNFPWEFKKYEYEVTGSHEPFRGRSVAGRAAHSIYFTLLPEFGIVGVILFLGMVFTSIKDLNYVKKISMKDKKENPRGIGTKYYGVALALEGSLIAYLVSGVFISTLYYPNFWFFMGFVLSLKNITRQKVKEFGGLSMASNMRTKPLPQ
jgi:O-antigen ligase